MKLTPLLATAILLCLSPALANANASAPPTLVPAGTPVAVHLVTPLSSSRAKDGDIFDVQVARDVVVNGLIVVRNGAQGQGTIRNVDHAGGNGHSGAMALTFDWVYSVDGGKIKLAQQTQKQAEEDRKGASSTATIIGIATFGLGGLFGHNLAHGREVTIDPDKTLNTFVADNVHVNATEHAHVDRFDH